MSTELSTLHGPVVILGGGGFIGWNLFLRCKSLNIETYNLLRNPESNWRVQQSKNPEHLSNIRNVDALNSYELKKTLLSIQPKIIFHCLSYGGSANQKDAQLMYRTNVMVLEELFSMFQGKANPPAIVHCGSSSEYGESVSDAREDTPLGAANSEYSLTKRAASEMIHFWAKRRNYPCVNMRLFSVYGPWESPNRLFPTLIKAVGQGAWPDLAEEDVAHDFIHVDDVTSALLMVAQKLLEQDQRIYGEHFNVGCGVNITLKQLCAKVAELVPGLANPIFGSYPTRQWDLKSWYANLDKSKSVLNWYPRISLSDGIHQTMSWWREYCLVPLKLAWPTVSVVVAVYKDALAIQELYQRCKNALESIGLNDFEIIFVNDSSPDHSEQEILNLSRQDARVWGVTHTRNFGSQSAFLSGLECAKKEFVVFMDGDLQDTPETIVDFLVEQKKTGVDVVLGRRVSREESLLWSQGARLFYRVLNFMSRDYRLPLDAGDFALMRRSSLSILLQFKERAPFLRILRAYCSFSSSSVPYHRPKRKYGTSTNSWIKNMDWFLKGLFSVETNSTIFLTALLIFIFTGYFMNSSILTIVFPVLWVGLFNYFIKKEMLSQLRGRPHFVRSYWLIEGRKQEVHQGVGSSS